MTRVADSNYWVFVEEIVPGRTHSFSYLVDGQVVASGDVAGYVHESYEAPGVPPGALSEERTVTSHVYPGAVTEYWVYINARADTDRGAPVMVWHDGRGYVGASDLIRHRLQIVSDNLVHRELIPPMVHVLVSPSRPFEELPLRYEGQSQEAAMRSLQYDTVSDRYAQHLLSEVLPDVDKVCNLRQDGYSRGSAGLSSGGISAFLLSWFHPDEFSRAHCGIGSFTGLQWDPDKGAGGGYILPFLVRRDARRNIRVWLSDGMNDIEVDHQGRKDLFVAGSWPLANLQMANALKLSNYDYHFRYGVAGHNAAQSALDLPESLAWLWRDYDPERDHQNFEQEAGEQAEPPYRVEVTNRRHW
jgi:enterochelin esterase family protein